MYGKRSYVFKVKISFSNLSGIAWKGPKLDDLIKEASSLAKNRKSKDAIHFHRSSFLHFKVIPTILCSCFNNGIWGGPVFSACAENSFCILRQSDCQTWLWTSHSDRKSLNRRLRLLDLTRARDSWWRPKEARSMRTRMNKTESKYQNKFWRGAGQLD